MDSCMSLLVSTCDIWNLEEGSFDEPNRDRYFPWVWDRRSEWMLLRRVHFLLHYEVVHHNPIPLLWKLL